MAFKWIRFLFAQSGDRTAIPNPTDLAGNVTYEQGYGPDYQRPKTDPLAKDIERQKMNSLFYDLTGKIKHWQTNTYPDWVPASDNNGVAIEYPLGAVVRYVTDGKIYRSAKAVNTSTPGANTDWVVEGGKVIAIRVISTTSTYTETPGTKNCIARLWGAGGGGGGSGTTGAGTLSVGGGGGGGSYAEGYYPVASLSGQLVTIGTGGSGGSGGIPTNGASGGTSSIGSVMTAPGGSGSATVATPQSGAGALGGTAQSGAPSGGNVRSVRGAAGSYGIQFAGVSNNAVGGPGGAAGDGTPGPAGPSVTAFGNNGVNPGTGGSGSVTLASGGAQQGGNGANGLCIIVELG